jgi:hypothetical protein
MSLLNPPAKNHLERVGTAFFDVLVVAQECATISRQHLLAHKHSQDKRSTVDHHISRKWLAKETKRNN